MSRNLNEEYWSERYASNNTGWDIGEISSPLKEYIDQITDKELKILIPGAGNSYEAEYLYRQGFKSVFVADIAEAPLDNLKKRLPEFPSHQLLKSDFFELQDKFDLILEQTFFCALPVNRRKDYAEKASHLLTENGKISGVFFNFNLTEDGPPFGGSKEEYLQYFSPYFEVEVLEKCYNSIPPRQGNELFFIFRKKQK
ncbi:SAM-dependent methyltransferase [Salegentibacter sp. F188]|uniref:SAM-dependent methyltransferase n=1 Tax=Autumnicola patrickiae TaxID=3075591 RepID=A0ABU3E8H0_9FLAO|nr:methyltransferase domain-containing protein [Salegentibacter sp. F188]MDT0691542.1 SAM-dependent methyltransferase [Salegentibacter sp. F188]